ncbi:MAG TPA: outer membrane beta-barrel protein [Pyrinomonadaceae bacterium]|nr:outer membrane beta-barrel protein [Pyrinomonadaceae bacterium]
MRKMTLRLTTAIVLSAAACLTAARAQEKDAPKAEIGVHFTNVEVNPPQTTGTATTPGFGARFTYNFTDHFAAEAEGNFFPQRQFFGRALQAQFGVKAGKRFRRFGVFAKARPGFVHFTEEGVVEPGPTVVISGTPVVLPQFVVKPQTHFSLDVGGVLEFYPSRRLVVRADAGDTMIRYGRRNDFGTTFPNFIVERPAEWTHNFQLTAGVGFRFFDPEGAPDDDPPSVDDADVPRFEAGIQYTSLSLDPPRQFFFSFDDPHFTEPAVGGRFTVNINDHFAGEAAVDFLTKDNPSSATYGGRGISGQFGVKAGKRFGSWGLFGKARPGFISYSEVIRLVGTETITFGGQQFEQGVFDFGRKTYKTFDLGGVLELYPSRRLVTRFDFGDNIIFYRDRHTASFLFTQPFFTQPDETKHNFQFSAGLGFRF